METLDRIAIGPAVCSGQPTVRGLRIAVAFVAKLVAVAGTCLAGTRFTSNPQAEMVTETARQSIEEVADDIGNYWTTCGLIAWMANGPANGTGDLAYTFARDVKVKRLIEAGRQDPERVGKLLVRKIESVIPHYHNARWLADMPFKERLALPGGWRSASTYKPVQKNSDSAELRLDEIEFAVFNSLHVLANLQYRPGMDALAKVISMKAPRACRYPAFLVHVADSFLSRYPQDTLSTAARACMGTHRLLLKGAQPGGWRVQVSRWDSPGDIADPMLGILGLDDTPLRKPELLMEVEIIPVDIDARLKDVDLEAVLANFVKFCAAREPAPPAR
jgi:hypothetical protein